jgi:hypothetical protein
MKAIDDLKRQFMALPEDRASVLFSVYSGETATARGREGMWEQILQDAPADKTYLETALRLEQPLSAEEEAPAPAVEQPVRRGTDEPPKPVRSRFGERSDDELGQILFGKR